MHKTNTQTKKVAIFTNTELQNKIIIIIVIIIIAGSLVIEVLFAIYETKEPAATD
jgi:hypothetical protein